MGYSDPVAPAGRMAGATGALRVGYQVAAVIGAWAIELTQTPQRVFQFRGVVADVDTHWMQENARDGFDLAVALGNAELLWRGVRIAIDGTILTATLTDRPIVTEWAPIEKDVSQ